MHSIRTKITLLTMVAILVTVLAVGGSSIFAIWKQAGENAQREMPLICENSQKSLNEYLNSIEQSVDMVSRYVVETLDSVELMEGEVMGADGMGGGPEDKDFHSAAQKHFDRYLHSHIEEVETVFRSVSNHTHGVLTYYYRINPQISQTEKGFWYSKLHNAAFVKSEVTELGDYDPEDMSHVGWYYVPLHRGRPSWLNPYYNDNLGIEIISYATPIFKAGTFIGIIGMDIDYDTLIDQIDDIQVYKTGYASLIDREGEILYHPWLETKNGLSLGDISKDLETAEVQMKEKPDDSGLVEYVYQGTKKKAAWSILSNGLILMIVAPEKEINESWMSLTYRIILILLVVFGVFIAFTSFMARKISEPLVQLSEASMLLAAGEYHVKLDYDGDDEVGVLTRSFRKLVEHLQVYISDLSSIAYKDTLTSVRNKAAFEIYSRKLNDTLRQENQETEPKFAIVMLDSNDLKEINDEFGHSRGDIYLRNSCQVICRTFSHSPVFRVGGDEFVAVLQNDDFENREELFRKFDRLVAENNEKASNPWDKVALAKGMAVYTSGIDADVDSVLRRADTLMYQDKRRMKG